ncbi:MFS transporter [Cognatishimia sp. F0-27]|uniref:MFS transporter n=1 Tax=Cognatishimia sp. F0-27 TaxID=2816855 RepID=UPI001D0C856F|nr:MFS transporter [Cognatishimia sp. F0-27]MCC1493032.1 MFS transporter [Cognatishimia sp. F0-27]
MVRTPSLFTPVLIVGCLIIIVSFGIRASFGLFQIPIAEDLGWMRADFSIAIAIQNLAWGVGQPFFGALAERIGDRKALLLGALLYVIGLLLSAEATTPFAMQQLSWLVGFGVAGTGFGVILAMVARSSSDANRSMALAITTAAGSAGQIFAPPLTEALLAVMPWQSVFVVFAGMVAASMLLLPAMRAPGPTSATEIREDFGAMLSRVARDPNFGLIALGFFSCGYHVAFLTAHFPAFVTERCGPVAPGGLLDSIGITTTSALGALTISVIGLFNIVGTLAAGWAGNRVPKKYLLSSIYAGRAVASVIFILTPMTPETVLVFAAVMGILWLATVPLTSGLIAHIFGLRHLGTLVGLVFLSHQLGSFLGVWLGGRLYDVTGDYTLVWWIGIAVGTVSALVHLPIEERPAPVPNPA